MTDGELDESGTFWYNQSVQHALCSVGGAVVYCLC